MKSISYNPLKYTDPTGYHHGPVAKPDDWTSSGDGSLYVNNYFTNDHAGNPFGSYQDRQTYNYDNSTGAWTNGVGQQVSPLEVYANNTWSQEMFSNFVEENSLVLPSNTDISSIEKKDGGYQYFTVDPSSSMWNSSPNEFNLHFAFFGNGSGSAGGGDFISDGLNYSSSALAAGAGQKYTGSNMFRSGFWRGANGKFYSMNATQKGKAGWVFYKGSADMAKNSVKWVSRFGNVLGGASALYSGYQFVNDPSVLSGTEFLVGVGSIFFWEVGAVYYGAKGFYELTNINVQHQISNGINPGSQFIFFKQ